MIASVYYNHYLKHAIISFPKNGSSTLDHMMGVGYDNTQDNALLPNWKKQSLQNVDGTNITLNFDLLSEYFITNFSDYTVHVIYREPVNRYTCAFLYEYVNHTDLFNYEMLEQNPGAVDYYKNLPDDFYVDYVMRIYKICGRQPTFSNTHFFNHLLLPVMLTLIPGINVKLHNLPEMAAIFDEIYGPGAVPVIHANSSEKQYSMLGDIQTTPIIQMFKERFTKAFNTIILDSDRIQAISK